LSLALARACRAVVVPDRQTRAMSRWNNGEEEDVLVDHRTSSPIMSVPTAALISPDDFVNQECRALVRCEHGRMLRHAREPTTSTAATSGRPYGLHTTASHMVAWWHPPILGKGPPRSAVSLLVNGTLTVLTQSQSHTSGAGRESRYIHDHWGANGQDPIDPSLYTRL
jgi:hypothetical protein